MVAVAWPAMFTLLRKCVMWLLLNSIHSLEASISLFQAFGKRFDKIFWLCGVSLLTRLLFCPPGMVAVAWLNVYSFEKVCHVATTCRLLERSLRFLGICFGSIGRISLFNLFPVSSLYDWPINLTNHPGSELRLSSATKQR
jgi:hypothetical protein